MSQSDAEATVEFAIRDAIISECHISKIDPDKVEMVVETVVKGLFSGATRWAAKAYADELDLQEVRSRGYKQQ